MDGLLGGGAAGGGGTGDKWHDDLVKMKRRLLQVRATIIAKNKNASCSQQKYPFKKERAQATRRAGALGLGLQRPQSRVPYPQRNARGEKPSARRGRRGRGTERERLRERPVPSVIVAASVSNCISTHPPQLYTSQRTNDPHPHPLPSPPLHARRHAQLAGANNEVYWNLLSAFLQKQVSKSELDAKAGG
jgi:hypothetical protein